jgi:Na+-transporting methylmalonyl-CoA/oxaloacetate decarboxylase beta subunit
LVGAAAQFGIFGAYIIALLIGFEPNQAAGIAIIGGADGPTAIFLSSKLSPNLLGAIAVCAYSYMACVPVITAAYHALVDYEERTSYSYETSSSGISYREDYYSRLSVCCLTCFVVPSGLPLLVCCSSVIF